MRFSLFIAITLIYAFAVTATHPPFDLSGCVNETKADYVETHCPEVIITWRRSTFGPTILSVEKIPAADPEDEENNKSATLRFPYALALLVVVLNNC
jgi:hypothetical protein